MAAAMSRWAPVAPCSPAPTGLTWAAATSGTTVSLGATSFGLNTYLATGPAGALFVSQ